MRTEFVIRFQLKEFNTSVKHILDNDYSEEEVSNLFACLEYCTDLVNAIKNRENND